MIRRSLLVVPAALLSGMALAAEPAASISGTIYGPQSEKVSYMWVRANDSEATERARAESSVDGSYELSDLPPGTYTLEIFTPCCAYLNYTSEEIAVGADDNVQFEIYLEEGSSFNTVGDDPGVVAAAIRSQAVVPEGPPPRTADGRPDLSGVWLVGFDPFPEQIDAQDWAREIRAERAANNARDHPHLSCLPGDPPIAGGASPFIAKLVQTPSLVVILMEDYPGFRQIFLDGRDHPEYPNPSWMGHSIGHWEGDTLVVDTVGFNDRGWMSMYPRSEELHIVERYTRTEFGYMEIEMTVEDDEVYNRPWVRNLPLHLAPQAELIEYVCENNKWAGAE